MKLENLKTNFRVSSQWLLPVVIMGVILSAGFLVVIPKTKQAWELRQANIANLRKLVLLEEKSKLLANLPLSEISKATETVLKAFPVENDPSYFLSVLQQYASKHNLVLQGFSLGKEQLTTESEADYLIIKANLTGSAENMALFFGQADQILPLIGVEDVVLEGDEEAIQANVVVKFFSRSLKEKYVLGDRLLPLSDDEKNVIETLSQYWQATKAIISPSPLLDRRSDPFF